MTPPSDFRQAVRISGWFLLLILIIGAGLFAVILFTGIQVSTSIFGTLLAAKIGMVSLLTAVATFLFRNFWDETKLSDNTSGLVKVVSYYRSSFLYLFASVLATIIAIGADLVTATGNAADSWRAMSLSTFSMAIILLLAFLVVLVGRTLAEMRTLLDACEAGNSKTTGSPPSPSQPSPRPPPVT